MPGALDHPLTGQPVLAFVTYGAAKLRNLRARPQLAVTFRSSWSWATVEGHAELIGPDDPHPNVDAERLRVLLREVFTAAGGQHDDWDALRPHDARAAKNRRLGATFTDLQQLSTATGRHAYYIRKSGS